jgi:hypothetical protein
MRASDSGLLMLAIKNEGWEMSADLLDDNETIYLQLRGLGIFASGWHRQNCVFPSACPALAGEEEPEA